MIISELFDDVGDKHQKKIAIDTVKNPSKSLLGGPSPEEAEKILKDKFGMSDKQIQKLKEGTMGIGLLGDDPKEINQAGYELISKLKAPVKAEDVYSFIEQRLSDDSLADSMYLMTKESYMDPRFKDSYGKHAKEIESIDARSILLHHLVGRDSPLMYYGIGPALVGLYLAQQGVKAVAINMDMDLPGRNDEPLIKEKYGVNVDVLKKEIERQWGKLPDMDQYALTQTYKAIGGTPKITAPAESIVKEDAQKYTPDQMIDIISDTMAEADSDFIADVGTNVLAGSCTVADDGEHILWDPELNEDYEKGRGPTGIAYAIKKGHPDAEDPKTGKKYPERQTPEYKKKFFKLNTNEAYGGEAGAESYLAKIDELVKILSTGGPESKSIAYEIQNAADDIRKSLGMKPTNIRMQFEGKAKPDFLDLDKDGDKKEPMKKAAKDKEEMEEGHKATHVVVDPDGKVIGHASDEKGAKFTARHNLQNVKGKVFKLKKPASEKKADRMMGYKLDEPTESAELKSFKELINQII